MEQRKDWRERLRKIVEDAGDNWAGISVAAGLNRGYLRDVLDRDQDIPSFKKAEKLSKVLKVSLEEWYLQPDAKTEPKGIGHGEGSAHVIIRGTVE